MIPQFAVLAHSFCFSMQRVVSAKTLRIQTALNFICPRPPDCYFGVLANLMNDLLAMLLKCITERAPHQQKRTSLRTMYRLRDNFFSKMDA